MSREKKTRFHDLVSGMDGGSFDDLRGEVRARECREWLGEADLSEMAESLGRKPACPECGSLSCRPWGRSKSGERRYVCSDCGRTFQLLSQSALAWSKRHLMDYAKALEMMSFNVPLDVVASVVGVHHNTALLWRRKAFATVAEWQRKTRLSGRVWIDEIYTFDYGDPGDHFRKMRRGLSKRKVCVCIAIDCRESLVIFETGHGCPTSAELLRALKGHIEPGSTIVHDGLMAHRRLIEALGSADEVYKSTVKDEASLKAMLMINSFSSWAKRYLDRFTGMRTKYLQDYLNWFAYVFRVKEQDEKWPKTERLLRHLLLSTENCKRSW
jgi:transposase-like protein